MVANAAHALRELGLADEPATWLSGEENLQRAWRSCKRGDWLLAVAAAAGVRRRTQVAAALDCAALALKHLPATEGAPREALATARAWLSRHVTPAEAWAAGFRAAEVASGYRGTDPRAYAAARCVADAAFACDDGADPLWYAARGYPAAVAVGCAAVFEGTGVDAGRICAGYVRAHIEASAVAAAIGPSLARRVTVRGSERSHTEPTSRRTGFEEFEGSGLVRSTDLLA